MNQDQLLRAMQANYIEYFRPFQTLPDAIWYEDEQVTWILPQGAPGNHVLKANFSAETLQSDLDALFASFDQHTYMVRWLIYPHDQPRILDDALGRRGLTISTGEPCMLRKLDDLPPQDVTSRLKIKLVRTSNELDDWRKATGAGFGGGYDFAGRWTETYRKKGLGADNHFLHFTGYLDGKPATSASMILAGGIAGIYDVSTPPLFRRRGLASAITLRLLHVARSRGYTHAYLRSSKLGYPVYANLGFETRFNERELLWRSPRLMTDSGD